jgi:hypothetical protein
MAMYCPHLHGDGPRKNPSDAENLIIQLYHVMAVCVSLYYVVADWHSACLALQTTGWVPVGTALQ